MAKSQKHSILSVFADKRMLVVLLLGFASGLPLALTGSTMQAWLTDSKLSVGSIGLFGMVGLPYSLKFVWAPFLDRYALPFLGLRRGWGIVSQLCLAVAVAVLAHISPVTDTTSFALVALVIAFFSASLDIVVDAYRAEILDKDAYGAGAGVGTTGYRLGMLISGSVGLILADGHLSWKNVYLVMAAVCLLGAVVLFLSPEPKVKRGAANAGLRDTVTLPFMELFQRSGALEILLFIMIYKLSTLMATALTTNYLMSLGYSKTVIGLINKNVGLVATIFGGLTGGGLMVKFGLKRSLWIFGIAQSIVGFTFWALPQLQSADAETANTAIMAAIVFVDNFMMGMGASAITGFMMSMSSLQFTGTQFALFSSLPAVTRVILTSQAGNLVEKFGYGPFFLSTVPMAIPGLLLLLRFDHWQSPAALVKKRISLYDKVTIVVFMISMIAISSDALWRWMDKKDVGQHVVIWGAIGTVCVIAAGLMKPLIQRLFVTIPVARVRRQG